MRVTSNWENLGLCDSIPKRPTRAAIIGKKKNLRENGLGRALITRGSGDGEVGGGGWSAAFQSMANSCTETERRVINTASNNYKTLLSRSQGPMKGRETLKSAVCLCREGGRGGGKTGGGVEARKWQKKKKKRPGTLGNGCLQKEKSERLMMIFVCFFVEKYSMVQMSEQKERAEYMKRGLLPSIGGPTLPLILPTQGGLRPNDCKLCLCAQPSQTQLLS